jgi:hypothetical protein
MVLSDQWVTANATALGALATSIGLIFTYIAIVKNSGSNRRNQRTNVIIHCSQRYDDLYKDRATLEAQIKTQKKGALDSPLGVESTDLELPYGVRSYFSRYYGLKSDQIDFWLAGYVDPETLASWLMSLVQNLYHDSIGGEYSFERGWSHVAKSHELINPTLHGFVEKFRRDKAIVLASPNKNAMYIKIISNIFEVERKQKKSMKWLTRDLMTSNVEGLVKTFSINLRKEAQAELRHIKRTWRRERVDSVTSALQGPDPGRL